MGIDEYLDAVFKEAFKRELEVDENVARTLPFFAATLALAATLYGYVLSKLPPPAWEVAAVVLDCLLLLGVGCLVGVLWNLFQAVRMREYRIPPKETELADWVGELRAFYEGQGQAPAEAEAEALVGLRERMIVEYAESAEHNRDANRPKVEARALGFTLLVVMLSIAFLMVGIMFATEWVSSIRQGSVHDAKPEAITATAGKSGCSVPAAAAPFPGAAPGREVSVGAGGHHGERKMTESSDGSPPANAPAPQGALAAPAAAQPPTAPPHQVLKKSESGGGPIERR